MTPDDDKTELFQRSDTGFPPTSLVAKTELVPPPPAPAQPDMGNGLAVGTRLGEFEITSLLGEGGFGIVYLAVDHSLGRRVALKEYMPSSLAARTADSQVQVKSERHRETFEAGRKSFVNEARLLAQFDHPSLVKVYRFWEANGTAYMVMPFYEGKNLRDTLRAMGRAPDEAWLRTLLVPLMEALEVIHKEQCFHRDIAPDNVMMLAGSQRPLLLDFGAARRVIGDMTQALTVILKPGYAPIEQYAEVPGMKQGAWTDVYALAAVVYFSIMGRTPPASVARMMTDSYVPLAQAAAGRYSAHFLEAVDRALVVRPEQRTQTIAAFREDLGLTRPLGLAPAPPPRPPADEKTIFVPRTERVTPTQAAQAFMQAAADAKAPPAAGAGPRGPARSYQAGPTPAPDRPAEAARAQRERDAISPVQAARSGPGSMVWGVGAAVLAAIAVAAYLVLRPSPAPTDPSRTVGQATTPQVQPASAPVVPIAASAPAVTPPPAGTARAASSGPFDPPREFERVVQAQSAGFGVQASAPRTTLRIGKDEFRFTVQADRPGYLYVLAVDGQGTLAQIVPNKRSGVVRLKAGQPWRFPAGDRFALEPQEPPGPTRFLMLVSAEPREFEAMKPEQAGDIRLFPSGTAATALAARHAGPAPVLAGQAACPAGTQPCNGDYGAAVLSFDVIR